MLRFIVGIPGEVHVDMVQVESRERSRLAEGHPELVEAQVEMLAGEVGYPFRLAVDRFRFELPDSIDVSGQVAGVGDSLVAGSENEGGAGQEGGRKCFHGSHN